MNACRSVSSLPTCKAQTRQLFTKLSNRYKTGWTRYTATKTRGYCLIKVQQHSACCLYFARGMVKQFGHIPFLKVQIRMLLCGRVKYMFTSNITVLYLL